MHVFTQESCWLLSAVLWLKLKCKIGFIRGPEYIHHAAVIYKNKYIDITGMYSEEEFLHLWQILKNDTTLKVSVATYAEFEDMIWIKLNSYNIPFIEDHHHYELACQCANLIASMLQIQ